MTTSDLTAAWSLWVVKRMDICMYSVSFRPGGGPRLVELAGADENGRLESLDVCNL